MCIFKIYKSSLKNCVAFFILLLVNTLQAQNSMVGDGFGGRLWYKPTNYTVGSYSGYSICYSGLCNNGPNQLYAWGSNIYGQLGYDRFALSGVITPTPIPNMNNVKFYSTGYCMGAIKNDSTGWVWGAAYTGITGAPVQAITNVKFLDAGIYNISFVKYDGTVWSLGQNAYGIFGDGTTTTPPGVPPVPVQMLNINTAVRVANNEYVTVILLSDGTVKVVGADLYGMLGVGSISSNSLTPISIPTLSHVVDIKACTEAVIALDSNGDVYTWGDGFLIGDGDVTQENTPKKITGLSNIVAISGCADGYHFMALDANKNCYAWGENYVGQLGIPNSSSSAALLPTLVATNVIDIMAGETFSYLVKDDGTLWCSGKSENGGSIWLNLSDQQRDAFTLIDPALVPGACGVNTSIVNTIPVCSNNNGSIVVTKIGGQAPYQYNIGGSNQTSNTFTNLATGNYTVTITDNNGCVNAVTCTINSGGPSPTITVNSPTIICVGAYASITASGATNYSWSNSIGLNSTTGTSVVANPTVTTIYTVTGTSSNECVGFNTSTVTVIATPCIDVFSELEIPNVFTPNGDDANDVFNIPSKGLITLHVEIYNRWGIKLFEWDGINGFWDGKTKSGIAPAGTYFYVLNYTDNDNHSKSAHGFLNLFRD